MESIKSVFHRCIETCTNFIDHNWRTIVLGLLSYFCTFVFIMGFFFFTGVGKWFDVTFTFLTATISFLLGLVISVIGLKIIRSLPIVLVASIVGAIVGIFSVGTYLGPFFRMMAFAVLVLGSLVALTIRMVRRTTKRRIWLICVMCSTTICVHGLFFYTIFSEGKSGSWSLKLSEKIATQAIQNPSIEGSLPIKSFTYGSGEDKRRAEYREVEYETQSVNMSPFIIQPKGLNKWYREWFWGFNLHQAPLNGRVWMPEEESAKGPFPLVLIVHGNHNMVDFSDGGYAYIGELLASRGYVVASIDQNFLNSGKSGHIGWDNSGRAWMLLKHLEQWDKWNKDRNHPLYSRIDMDKIGMIGHSRGGEAVSIATLMNELDRFPNNAKISLSFDFSIKSLIGLSPGDGRFKLGDQPVELNNINYLTLQGANDSDHVNYLGMRQYERVNFTGGFDGFKSSIYLYGANHGQFNSDWEVDQPAPYWWFRNRAEVMEPELQREMTKLYLSAFLDATLKDKKEYRQIFSSKDTASSWIPTDSIRQRYEESTFMPVATFEEDVDVTSLTQEGGGINGYNLQVWKEINLTLRNKEPQGNQAVKLGWRRSNARYSIKLPEEISASLDKETVLTFDAVQLHPSRYQFYGIQQPKGLEGEAIPISVILKSKGMMKLDSRNRTTISIDPTYSSNLYKFDWWNERFGNDYEHMLQTYEVPLSFLTEHIPSVNYETLDEIIFEFNQTESGLIFLDNIGFKK
ncbi:alpha/beta hydrolase [Sutcliffiella halmapala]|uniref:hypothetical protein n=1 Tax=Sutcliffiella halmapala TaxID=79882 RepID=UPI0009952FA3|nr:hypothetical protein [Sutcliffiella halmapala]